MKPQTDLRTYCRVRVKRQPSRKVGLSLASELQALTASKLLYVSSRGAGCAGAAALASAFGPAVRPSGPGGSLRVESPRNSPPNVAGLFPGGNRSVRPYRMMPTLRCPPMALAWPSGVRDRRYGQVAAGSGSVATASH
jgi:hypothetical protein